MSKKKRGWFGRPQKQRRGRARPVQRYTLDSFAPEDIIRVKANHERYRDFYWEYYGALARQRNKIGDNLLAALREASLGPYQFAGWQRAVRYKWSLNPLSAKGSLKIPGARFNIGDINSEFEKFPALYLAKDKMTAMYEFLYKKFDAAKTEETQAAFDSPLANQDSLTVVSVSGSLESVVDLTQPEKLNGFVDFIKSFTLPDHVLETAQRLNVPAGIVKTADQLVGTLLIKNWRAYPILFDLPANSQIFGHLVFKAGIEGIVYPSKFSDQPCLAIFPENLKDSKALIQMDDQPPSAQVPKKIDSTNWQQFV